MVRGGIVLKVPWLYRDGLISKSNELILPSQKEKRKKIERGKRTGGARK